MVTNQKPTGRAASMPTGLAMGGSVSLGITLLGTLILAKLLDSERMPWDCVGYGIMAMLMLGAMAGAITASRKIKRQRMLVCLLSGGVYFALLMSITALFFGGQYDSVGVTALLVLGTCTAAGFLGTGSRRRGNRKKSPLRRR